jgi:GT2 family glycosyltransferase
MRRPKIVLLGMLTKIPVAGVAWLVGQYALGFERLGYEVFYVEAHRRTPSMFMHRGGDDPTALAVSFLSRVLGRFGLEGRWAFHALHESGACYGMSEGELGRLYRDADLIVNLHGGTKPLPEHAASGRLVYLGTDPVQLELELHRGERAALEFLEPHVAAFTWGLNHGNPDCLLPWLEEHPFIPSPPPVVTSLWDDDDPSADAPFTTIGNWRQEWRDIEFGGERYHWSKHHEFLKILDLPNRVAADFELALGSYTDDDRQLLESHGWRVRNAMDFSTDLDAYRSYITRSNGEFTVAKDQNVRLRTGWFSERTATYLAAGRPVVMQDTGFGNVVPTGEGLFAFRDLDEATAAVETVRADPVRHRRAAMEVAREFFDSDVVLPALLDTVGMSVPTRPDHSARRSALATAELPRALRLTPRSRRPLELPNATTRVVLGRPVPRAGHLHSDHPFASIVVPTADNLVPCRLALESALAYTVDVPFELIVVDNGSSGPARQYLSALAARNANVRVLRNDENVGFARACNQGISATRGEVIVLLNDDTIVTPGWLRRLGGHLADRVVGLVGPTTNRCGNAAEVPVSYDTVGELLDFAAVRSAARRANGNGDRLMDLPVVVMFCVAARREVFDRVGPLDERYELGLFEDDDYSRRVRDRGLRVVCADDVFVHHFGEATIGRIAAAGGYGELFDANRRRFETKWGTQWKPHDRREDPTLRATRRLLPTVVEEHVPAGSVVLVISRGDEALLDLAGSEGWHFPSLADGTYAGHYPADDEGAISHLEAQRARGADHLVIPASAEWWLSHYREFRRHLDDHYRLAAYVPGTALIYALNTDRRAASPEESLA